VEVGHLQHILVRLAALEALIVFQVHLSLTQAEVADRHKAFPVVLVVLAEGVLVVNILFRLPRLALQTQEVAAVEIG